MSSVSKQPPPPGLASRVASAAVMGLTGLLCKAFLYGCNRVDLVGWDDFARLLESRRDVNRRQRGLLTVSNHISVIDDPLMWGVLPWRQVFTPSNLRWGLGAHDICYRHLPLGHFFFAGQTLPTHRLRHSPLGGLFQPTLSEAVRLLSAGPYAVLPTYTTTGSDAWPAPSAHHRLAWVHVFPEGAVHQPPAGAGYGLRYFRWGAARLLLEADPAPDVVPIFVEGTDRVMSEDRLWPRWLPRRAPLRLTFGAVLDSDAVFGDLRSRWRELVAAAGPTGMPGDLPETLRRGAEVDALRAEAARRLREEVLRLRRARGYADQDPALGRAEKWAADRPGRKGQRSEVDGSIVSQD